MLALYLDYIKSTVFNYIAFLSCLQPCEDVLTEGLTWQFSSFLIEQAVENLSS